MPALLRFGGDWTRFGADFSFGEWDIWSGTRRAAVHALHEAGPDHLSERYAALGAADRFVYVPYDGGHAFRADMRERSYAWFDHWLTEASAGAGV